MKQHLCRVLENRTLWSGVQLLALEAPELAGTMCPGQFALVRDPSTFDPYLRRTAWLFRAVDGRVALTLDAKDPLARRARVDDWLDVLAPLGNAVGLAANARHILLVGEGARLTPLIAIAENAIAQRREVVVISRAGSAAEILPAHLLAPEIEYRADVGELGSELAAWADCIYASGSSDLYRWLAPAVRGVRYRIEPGRVHALIDIPMPCGTGECYACAVKTRHGVQLACADGPFFDLSELD